MHTIFAPATVTGKSGVAVIRVSGSDVEAIARCLIGQVPEPRYATLANVTARDGRVLDRALSLFFRAPRSYTGEDVLELHLHGSVAVVNEVLSELSKFEACRLAEPGEFTLRALQNGKIDVSQVEGLGDLLSAETELQRAQAAKTMSGAVSSFADELRRILVRAGALLEATIDFADEEVPEDVSVEVLDLLNAVQAKMRKELDGFETAERLRSGFVVAIVGRPNVGKSTLINAIARREIALTSDIPGTTRDVLEARVDLKGLPVTFLDTAGVRVTQDPIESLGVARAMSSAKNADIRILLTERGEAPDLEPEGEDLVVWAKADVSDGDGLNVSGLTGKGVDELLDRVRGILLQRIEQAGSVNRERQYLSVSGALRHVEEAGRTVLDAPDVAEVAALQVREALLKIDSLVGRVDIDDYLDVIFSSFCLGK